MLNPLCPNKPDSISQGSAKPLRFPRLQSAAHAPIGIRERAIAISDDVEVSEVKIGRKPSLSHDNDYPAISPGLFVQAKRSPR
jgi:hypothetical protein